MDMRDISEILKRLEEAEKEMKKREKRYKTEQAESVKEIEVFGTCDNAAVLESYEELIYYRNEVNLLRWVLNLPLI